MGMYFFILYDQRNWTWGRRLPTFEQKLGDCRNSHSCYYWTNNSNHPPKPCLANLCNFSGRTCEEKQHHKQYARKRKEGFAKNRITEGTLSPRRISKIVDTYDGDYQDGHHAQKKYYSMKSSGITPLDRIAHSLTGSVGFVRIIS